MIKTSRVRLRWREGAHTGDEWIISRLEFFDMSRNQVLPKKGLSTGSHQDFSAHDNVLFRSKDGYTYNYNPLEWRGQSYNGDIYIGGTFPKNVDIRYIDVTHRQDPVSSFGKSVSLCAEYWNGRMWMEYPTDYVMLTNIYSISYYEEKKYREKPEVKHAVRASIFDSDAPLTDSGVSYLMDRNEIEPANEWRITCEENLHWAWDVKCLRFIGLDDEYIRPKRAFSSGEFDPQSSANQAVYNLGNIWGGHKDSTGLFYIGCLFEDDILPSHVEISQPYGINMRNDLYVEFFDVVSEEWRRVARYTFHNHFIKRGPIALPIIKRYELGILGNVDSVVPFGESSICDEATVEYKYKKNI